MTIPEEVIKKIKDKASRMMNKWNPWTLPDIRDKQIAKINFKFGFEQGAEYGYKLHNSEGKTND